MSGKDNRRESGLDSTCERGSTRELGLGSTRERGLSSTRERGLDAEARAVAILEQRGYVIAERNVRNHAAEIDIIAWDGDVLCFVEVRSVATAEHGGPLATVGRTKQQRLVRGARVYIQERALEHVAVRFDVIGLVVGGAGAGYELVPGAFVSGT